MRFRLQLFLPLAVGLLVAAGFVIAAITVADGVRQALLTVPGLTRDRAVEAAVAAVIMAGALVTGACVILSVVLTRMMVGPLRRMQRAADRLAESGTQMDPTTPLAEIQDVAHGVNRIAGELHARHGRERRTRTELEALLDAVSEGILQVDERGRITRVNPAGVRLLGLPGDSPGRPLASLLRNHELRRAIARAVSRGVTGGEEVVLDERRILVTVAPQPRGGAVATFVDLTALRRLEEVRRDFVANASHELKTPLTSIRGYAETLLTGDLAEPDRRRFLTTIHRNAERLQRIVDDLLDLSRLEAGRWKPELETLHVLPIAESAWEGFADRAAAHGIRFSAEAADDDRAHADRAAGQSRADANDGDDRHRPDDLAIVDRNALEQIFTNLFDNALRYTPDGGRVSVTVRKLEDARAPGTHPGTARAASDEQPRDWLVVEVSDSGAGIPRDTLPRIFERFYRADPARSRAEGGTGLGLAIVKHMTESMGGAVGAESVLGKGTTLRLLLPR